ncbi:MAG TPA: folate-binding protein [Hyphomicrobiaceae bacterium]|nr:folate-binding protein [Hyphomicrobiaceae bacterium]
MAAWIRLADRGVVSVTGPEAAGFLDNLLTNDMAVLERQPALLAGLLTPQGKILFEMLVVKANDGFWLETGRDAAPALAKRLSMYKLRAKVGIEDRSGDACVAVALDGGTEQRAGSVRFPDPRAPGLGNRIIAVAGLAADLSDEGPYHRRRIALGIGEASRDYPLGDTFPHEANWDRIGGVSFTKGCFVGQEVVARMQHKTIVRKRLVRVSGAGPLEAGAPVLLGEVEIGRLGTVEGRDGLALVRLDRALEAEPSLTSGGTAITIDADTLDRYRRETAERDARSKAPL